jgi:trans-2,3-dihydro-3-hydroxyanthranilate isomerase
MIQEVGVPRAYSIYDVFTDKKLAGNPLAVIFEAEGLSDEAMQAIAREMNLSETVFVLPPNNPAHTAKIRIFTPGRELPFAGHPTVGTAVALAEDKHERNGNTDIDVVSVLEEEVGPVRCAVKLRSDGAGFAEFDLPRKSNSIALPLEKEGIAEALSLNPAQIGFENHQISIWSAGVPFLLVPVHDVATASQIEFDPGLWERAVPFVEGRLASAYVYTRGGIHHHANFHARMFSPDMGIAEDPATGAAVAALSGAIRFYDDLNDGHHSLVVEQGVEMGRPSFIHLHMSVAGGAIATARIGGQAVRIASGTLDI